MPEGAKRSRRALVAGVLTILFGLVANYPFAMATGLGINAFVAVTIAPQMSWPAAMGLVLVNGVVVLILVLAGVRTMVFNAVPPSLKAAIADYKRKQDQDKVGAGAGTHAQPSA